MTQIPRYTVKLVKEDSIQYKVQVNSPGAASDVLVDYFSDKDREHCVVLLLDTKHRLIGLNTVSIGSLNQSIVHPREIFKPAILSNAGAIIVAHNHPSGDTKPSKEDLAVTERLKKAGKILDIPLLDHIIVGDSCYSILKEGYC